MSFRAEKLELSFGSCSRELREMAVEGDGEEMIRKELGCARLHGVLQ
jgi:hypothetical protein